MPRHLGGRRIMKKGRRIRKKLRKTSTDNGHNHTWMTGNKFTSSDLGATGVPHKHEIDLVKGIAKESQGHTHKLL